MSLCTVAELRSVLGIGALYTDAQLQEVCDAADNVLLPMLWIVLSVFEVQRGAFSVEAAARSAASSIGGSMGLVARPVSRSTE